ncbi:stage II sporulation protein R [Paenibacillus thiaminolyticus]|nr:stage II sporulation protein R [Paenibacillus thiaminolyticus]
MKSRMFVLGLLLAIIAAGTWMRWDQGRAAAAVEEAGLAGITTAEAGQTTAVAIPEDAIRLRVLANSDTDDDQRVKRLVRDGIVEHLNGWLGQHTAPQTREEAREFIAAHLKELENTVARTLADEGMPYSARLTLGEVPFPAKLYGGQVYPAGMYEALLVTLGAGKARTGGAYCSRRSASLMGIRARRRRRTPVPEAKASQRQQRGRMKLQRARQAGRPGGTAVLPVRERSQVRMAEQKCASFCGICW